MRRTHLWLLGALLASFGLSACGGGAGEPQATGAALYVQRIAGLFGARKDEAPKGPRKETVPVHIGTVTRQPMPVQHTEIGRVEAYSTIEVKAQVSGELVEVAFEEGDEVEQGQVLFRIDPRPFEVALREAEANLARAEAEADESRANLARDKAQADNAEARLARDAQLLTKGMASEEEVDQVKANAETLKAAVAADEAAIRSSVQSVRAAKVAIEDAKLQLDYCTIRSPLKGVTGSLLVNRGNLVRANDTAPLVTIAQIRPIYVSFALRENLLAVVRERMAQEPLDVRVTVRGGESTPITGRLTFIDNTVDRTSGTIRLKATFDNADGRLWPGQFVDAALQVSVLEDAVVAPTAAVQSGQSGPYAYVVKPDLTVELRNIVAGEVQGDLTIIEDGLAPDEKVVTDGQLRLSPGSAISIAGEAAG